jgi:hypothetical protein
MIRWVASPIQTGTWSPLAGSSPNGRGARGQQHTEQRRIRLTQARYLGEQCARVNAVWRIERQAEIDDQPCSLRFDLDAGAANLSRTAQDS